jgi:phosphate transport system permease protein
VSFIVYSQNFQSKILRGFVYTAALVTGGIILSILIYILIRGIPNLSTSLFDIHYTSENLSLFPALVNTIVAAGITLLLAVPVGIGSAVFLAEYAKRGSRFVKIIRMTAETLAGIPSIVYGLFGFLFFVSALRWGYSLLAGCCTLAIMILPVIMRTSEEAILAVSDSYREASFGLGAGKLRTVFSVVLPAALPGISAGIVLGMGRIVGETAALIYTAGSVARIPPSLMGSGRTLSVHLYALWSEGLATGQAYATAVILLCSILVLNTLSDVLERFFVRKTMGKR